MEAAQNIALLRFNLFIEVGLKLFDFHIYTVTLNPKPSFPLLFRCMTRVLGTFTPFSKNTNLNSYAISRGAINPSAPHPSLLTR